MLVPGMVDFLNTSRHCRKAWFNRAELLKLACSSYKLSAAILDRPYAVAPHGAIADHLLAI